MKNYKINNYKPTTFEQIRALMAFPFAAAAVLVGGRYFCIRCMESIAEVLQEYKDAK